MDKRRSTLIWLLVINTSLTLASEVFGRTLLYRFFGEGMVEPFFVSSPSGWQIHRQSLIAIFMTAFVSVVGGPIFLVTGRRARLYYFLAVGVVSTLLAQAAASWMLFGLVTIQAARIFFDLSYTTLVRFPWFEIGRPALLKCASSPGRLFLFRLSQDSLLAVVRVVVLSVIGLRH